MSRTKRDEAAEDEKQAAPAAEPKAEQASVQTTQEAVADPFTDSTNRVARGGKAEAMREKLQAEPKVRVLIPLANGERDGVTQSVILNGYSLYIRKGEYVDVPQSVAEVLEAKMKHKIAVNKHPLRANREGGVQLDQYGS